MIYAKVDVKLRDHVRAHRAGAAMATWLWGLCYAREQETDGHIPEDMIRLAWVGEREGKRHAELLVSVGLWEVDPDGGWRICRYGDKNETAAAIAERRAEAANRMRRVRANRERTSGERSHEQPGAVPGSGSGSGSGSDPRSEEPTSTPRATPLALGSAGDLPRPPPANDQPAEVRPLAQLPDPSGKPPPWWSAVLGTVADSTGIGLPNGASWLRYAGHRHGKRLPAVREDALYWLTTVMVPEEQRKRAEERHRAERDAKFDAEREAARTPQAAPYHARPAKGARPKPKPEERPPTPEERAQMLALSATLFAPPKPKTGTDE